MSILRKKWLIILVVIIGIAVAFYSWGTIQKQVANAEKTTSVVVPAKDIEAYSVVSPQNLTTVQMPLRTIDKYMSRDKAEIANKVTTVPLFAKKPIDKRLLTDKENDLGNKQVVGVCIDAARYAGVQDGDLVDIYWLQATEIAQPSVSIARNVRVLRVSDDRGVPVKSSSIVAQNVGADTGLTRTPKIVYLILAPEEVPYVINGSSQNGSIALAKKSKADEPIIPVEEDQNAAKNKQNNKW